jgi:hypothetical protein
MTRTSDTSAQRADLLRRLRQPPPAIDMFDESGGTTLFAFRPARERYVPDDEMKLAARVHQDLLRIYLAPMFDIVLKSDATTPHQ